MNEVNVTLLLHKQKQISQLFNQSKKMSFLLQM